MIASYSSKQRNKDGYDYSGVESSLSSIPFVSRYVLIPVIVRWRTMERNWRQLSATWTAAFAGTWRLQNSHPSNSFEIESFFWLGWHFSWRRLILWPRWSLIQSLNPPVDLQNLQRVDRTRHKKTFHIDATDRAPILNVGHAVRTHTRVPTWQ